MKALRLLALPAVLIAATVVLLLAGSGDLSAPPVGSVDELRAWLDDRDAVTAALALVRVVALGAAVYLAIVTAVAAVARITGADGVADAADRAVPPAVRRLASGLAGAGLASATLLGAAPGHLPHPAPPPSAGEPIVGLPDDEGTATMSVVPEDAPAPAAEPASAATWTVASGESFWSIAESVVADATGRAPSDPEIAAYWRGLIEANRDRITSGDPDLVYPGQVFVLPDL